MVGRNNFKNIAVVPNGKDMVDAILSPQHYSGTPGPIPIHDGGSYPMSTHGFREFYIRKLKSTENYFNVKLTVVMADFPRLDYNTIHPFHADRIGNKYRYYASAVDEIDRARSLITTISSYYVSLVRNCGEGVLYFCNSLKVIAIGRMCTAIKRIEPSLAYLEQVRREMAWDPATSIDPYARTILMCGYPSAGKSSFMHRIVDDDDDDNDGDINNPYVLSVGHTEYENLRYQVINVPDYESVTPLAHLRATTALFFLDLSGGARCSIDQQASLFLSTRFELGKPLRIVVLVDGGRGWGGLSEWERKRVMELESQAANNNYGDEMGMVVINMMSTLSVEGVKNAACRRLLNMRVELKMMNDGDEMMIRPLSKLPAGEFRGGYNANVFEVDIDPDIDRRLGELEREEGEGITWKGMGWQLSRL